MARGALAGGRGGCAHTLIHTPTNTHTNTTSVRGREREGRGRWEGDATGRREKAMFRPGSRRARRVANHSPLLLLHCPLPHHATQRCLLHHTSVAHTTTLPSHVTFFLCSGSERSMQRGAPLPPTVRLSTPSSLPLHCPAAFSNHATAGARQGRGTRH